MHFHRFGLEGLTVKEIVRAQFTFFKCTTIMSGQGGDTFERAYTWATAMWATILKNIVLGECIKRDFFTLVIDCHDNRDTEVKGREHALALMW